MIFALLRVGIYSLELLIVRKVARLGPKEECTFLVLSVVLLVLPVVLLVLPMVLLILSMVLLEKTITYYHPTAFALVAGRKATPSHTGPFLYTKAASAREIILLWWFFLARKTPVTTIGLTQDLTEDSIIRFKRYKYSQRERSRRARTASRVSKADWHLLAASVGPSDASSRSGTRSWLG